MVSALPWAGLMRLQPQAGTKEGAMVTSAILHTPKRLTIGNSTLHLDQEETAALAFINGVTAGHLAYMVYGKKARLFDTDLILLMVARQHTRQSSAAFNAGYVVGY